MRRERLFWIVVWVFVAVSGEARYPRIERFVQLTAAQAAIRNAGAIADSAAREAPLREAIRAGLMHHDARQREYVFAYLVHLNHRCLDLRPFADILEEYGRRHDKQGGFGLADTAELIWAPRAERIETYRSAILKGMLIQKRGSVVRGCSVVRAAAWQGLDELGPLIGTHWEGLGCGGAEELDEIRLVLSLRAGAENQRQAELLAARRLAAMTDDEVWQRASGNPIFARELWQTADFACEPDPFVGEVAAECEALRSLAMRLLAHFQRGQERQPAQAITPEERRVAALKRLFRQDEPTWLTNLLGNTGVHQ